MAKRRIVVVGGDAAGMSAASQARRLDRDLEIRVFERGPHTSYSACGIPYLVAGLVEDPNRLVARTPEEFREQGIHVSTRHEVTALDPSCRRVTVHDLVGGRLFEEPYDDLLLATGATPLRPPVPGIDAAGVFGVSTLASGVALLRFVEEQRPRKVVVVGGGYIGLEIAEAFNCHRGLEVSLVERAPQVMGTLDPDMGALVSQALREVGIRLFLEETLQGVEVRDGRAVGVRTDKRLLEADLVVLGLGVVPQTELAKRAGLALGVRGALVVDSRMRTPTAGIWGAGDCAQTFNLASRRPFHVALGTVANKMGRVAGINLAGGDAVFPGALGTAVCKICKYEAARTGLLERELTELGIPWTGATIEESTRAGYYPGAGDMTVKLLAERPSGRILGGQIVGIEGAAKRIDVVAAAIRGGLTAQDMVDLDLSYAPPFSPVWDPVQVAARRLLSLLKD